MKTTMIVSMLALLITGCGNGNDDNRAGPVGPTDPAAPAPASIAPDSIVGATFTYRITKSKLACEPAFREVIPPSIRTVRYEPGMIVSSFPLYPDDDYPDDDTGTDVDWTYRRTGNDGVIEYTVTLPAEEWEDGWILERQWFSETTLAFTSRGGGTSTERTGVVIENNDCNTGVYSGGFSVIYPVAKGNRNMKTTMIVLLLALLSVACGDGNDGNPAAPSAPLPVIHAPDSILGATFTYRITDGRSRACDPPFEDYPVQFRTVRYESGMFIVNPDDGDWAETVDADWTYRRTGNVGVIEYTVIEIITGYEHTYLIEITHTFTSRGGGTFTLRSGLEMEDDSCKTSVQSGDFSVIYG